MTSSGRRAIKSSHAYTKHEGSIWIEENRHALKDNFWVAANRFGLVADDQTIDGLIEKIEEKHFQLSDLSIAFITSKSI